jgi:protein tyrosine/serine phosphatase
VSAPGSVSRALSWEGSCNVRDLGGLPTEDGRETRFGVVVRADDVSLLAPSGWRALEEYGVRRLVDLRHEDPPYEAPVELVRVPLLDDRGIREVDRLLLDVEDVVEWRTRNYLFFLERFASAFAAAVDAIGAPVDGTVLVHCAGGVDRTGLVAAFLLRLAGVEPDTIAEDYALSEASWASTTEEWVGLAPDEVEARKRRILSVMPAEAMRNVLDELERRHGSIREFLLESGADTERLDAVRHRLRA